MKDRKFTSKREVIIILAVVAIFAAYFIYRELSPADESQLYASITYKGKQIYSLDLDTPQIVEIPQNPEVKIQVNSEGKVGFIASDCPDKVCINEGFLGQSGQIASCLPNSVVLLVKNKGEGSQQVDIAA